MQVLSHSSRRAVLVRAIAALVLAASVALAGVGRAQAVPLPTGLSQLLAQLEPTALTRGIATFNAPPTALDATALESVGLSVQRLRNLPLALVYGPVAAMQAAVTGGLAVDVYPDEVIDLLDTYSSDAMGAASARAAGLTGQGVTVAVVDSGCDASHPDLADHVAHNVKLYSGEYVNLRPEPNATIVVANETGPYQNTDIGSGHGTHVAGIIAADSTTDPSGGRLGVAPDATLVCYSIGEVLFTTAVVTAYDHMLQQEDLWGIDVVNNSWGNSFQQFNPGHPVAVATRAVADTGVVVVFAAGNSGYTETEMSLNPFSQAPWVISVAASNIDDSIVNRAEFSSNGLVFDNAEARFDGRHTVFLGDRIGLYHPDVTAPGDNISSTCSSASTIIGPCPPPTYTNAVAGGTSMASPHVAGAAAVLLQANPNLTRDQVRMALQATATPVTRFGSTTETAPFWQVGYGHVDLAAAINLVKSKNWSKNLARAQSTADARVLAADRFKAIRSDFWTYAAPPIAVEGATDSQDFTAPVGLGVSHLKVALSHPSLAVAQLNGTEYTVTVYDAAGTQVAVTTEAYILGAGTSSVLIDFSELDQPPVLGTWTFHVSGDLAASDPDTLDSESLLGDTVTLTVVQLSVG
jgi:serine protease AprX